ncbi:MAG: hypothetical protein JSV64_01440 [Candidatus Bathyarchaeota archaeon]|nr:MAG: hypothetical protein JSV64_01440 [Candidatus Bathyarchaeota archaeon]
MGSIRSRVVGTVVVIWCWLVFTLAFLAFYPTGFDLWQNLAFFLISALIASGIVILMWIRMIHL